MDFKQAVIENAWGGLSMDYGLLHLQLATPLVVLLILLIMIFTLNKLLFQPVLRTLDNRKQVIDNSQSQVARAIEEIEELRVEIDHKLHEARTQVMHLINEARDVGIHEKEVMIHTELEKLEEELEQNRAELQQQVTAAKAELQTVSVEIATNTAARLLS
ncbi:MAG TPA: hypothetical protein EYG15_05880 [Deltaproteobacteria bacterium]|nr:hypothetical protein [Candidatus Lambdaproteobacteria bacterium]HIL15618.1 hypothetical protein [Deltaproteobacteria bacterium]